VFVGLASTIHRSITTTLYLSAEISRLKTHHTSHLQPQTAAMVQTTGMLGEGTHIHERMTGRRNGPD
jgi:hypothetical protein